MTHQLILPDLVLPTRAHQTWLFSGTDSIEHCQNKQHFLDYPFPVEYCYNSRGFRDSEWPDHLEDLSQAVWCIGDSFTVGIGQPLAHIWPQVLQSRVSRRCINISMDGASNDWILRRAQDIMHSVAPRHMVLMWSYTHRRESADLDKTDEQRALHYSRDTVEQDTDRWLAMSNTIQRLYPSIVQCTIPAFVSRNTDSLQVQWDNVKGTDWPACPQTLSDLHNLPGSIRTELRTLHNCMTAWHRCCRSKIRSRP